MSRVPLSSLSQKQLNQGVARWFWRAMKPDLWIWIIEATALIIAYGAITVSQLSVANLVDALRTQPSSTSSMNHIWVIAAMIVGSYALTQAFRRLYGYLAVFTQTRAMARLEEWASEYLLYHSHQFFADQFSGTLVKRVTRLARTFMELSDIAGFNVIPILTSVTWTLIVTARHSLVVAGCVLAWFVILVGYNLVASKRVQKLREQRTAKDSELIGYLSDVISNATTIKLFVAIKREVQALRVLIHQRTGLHARVWLSGERVFLIQNILMVVTEAAVLYFGIHAWSKGLVSVGDLVFFQTSLLSLFDRSFDLNRIIRTFHDSLTEAREMVEILEIPHEIVDRNGAKSLKVKQGEIVFDGVTFKYKNERTVLKKMDLTIAPGEKIALVGPSGAGKSTVVKLLFRFYELTKGRILVDGQDIAKVTQDSLREALSLVPQEPILFHRSLKENIRYGRPDATDEEVMKAAKQAHCHEFILGLQDGYDTYVGERGVKLSGGERQRVAIARAILKNAPILVLDEATSSLDSESESLIQDALHILMKGKTVIVIAHRLSTIMQMDRIIVLENGSIADTGTHQELLQTEGGLYKKLWQLQAGGFLQE